MWDLIIDSLPLYDYETWEIFGSKSTSLVHRFSHVKEEDYPSVNTTRIPIYEEILQ